VHGNETLEQKWELDMGLERLTASQAREVRRNQSWDQKGSRASRQERCIRMGWRRDAGVGTGEVHVMNGETAVKR